jgi:hypothetical protein
VELFFPLRAVDLEIEKKCCEFARNLKNPIKLRHFVVFTVPRRLRESYWSTDSEVRMSRFGD